MEDILSLVRLGETEDRRGDRARAGAYFKQAVDAVHAHEREYSAAVRALGAHLARTERFRSAIAAEFYLAASDPSALGRAEALFEKVPPEDRARTLAAKASPQGTRGKERGIVPTGSEKSLFTKAAQELERAGKLVGAAIHFEHAADLQGARALWSRLSQLSSSTTDHYRSGLIYFNLARITRETGDDAAARSAFVTSVRFLEEAADHFEAEGQRERAFDCFQVLIEVGKLSDSFENVLEGFVNCVRILREDHLKYFALEHLDDAIASASRADEPSASATLAREAADYARSIGLPDLARGYSAREGDLWYAVFEQHERRGDPPEVAENALLASILAYGEVGRWDAVGARYRKLSELDLEERRKAHYARASERYRGVPSASGAGTPADTRPPRDAQAIDIWKVDLLEWEERGDPMETTAEVLLNKKWPDVVRRRALLARLAAGDAEIARGNARIEAIRALAARLGQLQLYSVLPSLELLYRETAPQVKAAVVDALASLFFKRSFATLRVAIREPERIILDASARTLAALYFPHAFDPLSRILRETNDGAIRTGAISALARIDTVEAAEFMLGLLDHGSPDDRRAATDALSRAHGMRFVEFARSAWETLPEVQREALRTIFRARNVSPV